MDIFDVFDSIAKSKKRGELSTDDENVVAKLKQYSDQENKVDAVNKNWVYKTQRDFPDICKSLKISKLIANILYNRGYETKAEMDSMLNPEYAQLRDVTEMKDAVTGADLIIEALNNKDKIIVYGDYDADGVCSIVVMMLLLKKINPNVGYYTNNRFVSGFGICEAGIDEIIEKHPDVKMILTVDNGITGNEAVAYAKQIGLKVIITDHHEPGEALPVADAVIDPRRKDDTYPFKGLCGAGLAFKLMMLVYSKLGRRASEVYEVLDIVALATVADVVPLVDENRVIVSKGIELMRQGKRHLFKIWREMKRVSEVDSHTLGFIYGPMINAVGRLKGEPSVAIDMFLTDDEKRIRYSISLLDDVNEDRKIITKQMQDKADKILEKKGLKEVIVLYDEGFHEGIVGLVAGRMKEKHNRPAIVFAKKDENELKGSGRSIDNFFMKDSFDEVRDCLNGYGGHEKAGGVSLDKDRLAEFEQRIISLAKKKLTADDYVKKFVIDARINAHDLDIGMVNDLRKLEPFGEGFRQPIIGLDGFEAYEYRVIGSDKQHVKLIGDFEVLLWKAVEKFTLNSCPLSITAIGLPQINEYNGRTTLQFAVNDENFEAF